VRERTRERAALCGAELDDSTWPDCESAWAPSRLSVPERQDIATTPAEIFAGSAAPRRPGRSTAIELGQAHIRHATPDALLRAEHRWMLAEVRARWTGFSRAGVKGS
jgi:hypothetical protein